MSLIYCLKACQRKREAKRGERDGGWRRRCGVEEEEEEEGVADRDKLELKGRRVL